jgi:hypothetical protein
VKSEVKVQFFHCFHGEKRKERKKRQVRKYKEAKGDLKYINNQQMHFNIYDVFCLQSPHQHVSAGIPSIFRGMLLLKEHKRTNMVKCVTITS